MPSTKAYVPQLQGTPERWFNGNEFFYTAFERDFPKMTREVFDELTDKAWMNLPEECIEFFEELGRKDKKRHDK